MSALYVCKNIWCIVCALVLYRFVCQMVWKNNFVLHLKFLLLWTAFHPKRAVWLCAHSAIYIRCTYLAAIESDVVFTRLCMWEKSICKLVSGWSFTTDYVCNEIARLSINENHPRFENWIKSIYSINSLNDTLWVRRKLKLLKLRNKGSMSQLCILESSSLLYYSFYKSA